MNLESIDRVILDLARGWLDLAAAGRRGLRVAPAGPLRRAVLAARLAEAFDALTAEAIADARSQDRSLSWAMIGDAFGIRAQSAHQRFGRARSERET